MNNIKKLVGLILMFGMINLILWGGQELYYYNDTREINRIKISIENEKNEIAYLESRISSLSNEIDFKELELDRYKNANMIDKYNKEVSSYNLLLNKYNNKINIYDYKIKEYNQKIEEVNVLIKSSGSRWYLIPIPLPTKRIN